MFNLNRHFKSMRVLIALLVLFVSMLVPQPTFAFDDVEVGSFEPPPVAVVLISDTEAQATTNQIFFESFTFYRAAVTPVANLAPVSTSILIRFDTPNIALINTPRRKPPPKQATANRSYITHDTSLVSVPILNRKHLFTPPYFRFHENRRQG